MIGQYVQILDKLRYQGLIIHKCLVDLGFRNITCRRVIKGKSKSKYLLFQVWKGVFLALHLILRCRIFILLHFQSKFDSYLTFFFHCTYIRPWIYLMGSVLITLVGPSVCQSVVHPSLYVSETSHQFFLKVCMKLIVNKVKKVTGPEFSKKS